MSGYKTVIPALVGAVAGGLIALAVAGGGSSTHSTTTTVLQTPGASAVPTSLGGSGKGLTINQIYRQASPGVVDIIVTQHEPAVAASALRRQRQQKTEGEGAGVVYDTKGDILTDEHVVAGATSVKVTLPGRPDRHRPRCSAPTRRPTSR